MARSLSVRMPWLAGMTEGPVVRVGSGGLSDTVKVGLRIGVASWTAAVGG